MRKTLRLKPYDYRYDGIYFVTICVKEAEPVLSNICDEKIELTKYGMVVDSEIQQTKCIRPYVLIDEYIIMPDHVHMLIHIYGTSFNIEQQATHRVAPTHDMRLYGCSLGAILGQIKSICTKQIRRMGLFDFEWQRNYYERVIRDENELHRIREYIRSNPKRRI